MSAVEQDTVEATVKKPRKRKFLHAAIVLLVVTPIVVATTFMWSLWDPSHYLSEVKLAVVNEDLGGEQNGEKVEYGETIADGLLDTDYLDFEKTSASEADEGLRTGKYMFVVSIPQDFSQDILTLLSDNPTQPEVVISFNDYYGTNSPVVTEALVPKIEQKVSAGITKRYAEKLLNGIDKMGNGLNTAAEGAAKLDNGATQLQDGLAQGASGAQRLDAGAAKLHDGTTRLVDGTTQLSAGAGRLAQGMDTLVDGTARLGAGASQIDQGVGQLTSTLIPVLQQASGAVDVLAPTADLLDGLGQHEQSQKIRQLIAQLSADNPNNMANKLQQLKDGTAQLSQNLNDPNSQYLSGVLRLRNGAQELSQATVRLQDGAGQLNEGTTTLVDGTGRLVEGTTKLSDGANRLKAGTNQLATRLEQGSAAAPKVGNLPNATTQVAVPVSYNEDYHNPVQTIIDESNPTQKSLSGGLSIILLLAFGFLGMAIVSMLAPHILGRKRFKGAVAQVFSGFAIVGLGNLALLALLALVSKAVGWTYQSTGAMLITFVAMAACGTAIYQMLRICFGRILGGILAFGFFAFGMFSSGIVWPLQTTPGALRLLNPIHPMAYARSAFMEASAGYTDGTFWRSILMLLLTAAISLAISIVVRRRRLRNLRAETTPEYDDRVLQNV